MFDDPNELRRQLQSSDIDELHSAIIDAGKAGYFMLTDDIVRLLHHPHEAVRGAAIRVLGFYWKLDGYREISEEMMLHDPDEDVRGIALMAWAGYSAETRDPHVMSRLYDMLRDPGEIEDVRAAAYPALLSVSGLPKPEWPRNADVYGNIEKGVNWALVNRLMKSIAPN